MTSESSKVGPSGRRIIYDENGKPCRSCNSLLDFKSAMGLPTTSTNHKKPANPMLAIGALAGSTTVMADYPKDCPADVEVLGRSSWTLLHSIAATYPEHPTQDQQQDMTQFISLFAKFYPCWFCASDFQKFIKKDEPKVQTQDQFGKWLCDAHNEVNKKLGKKQFDCQLWKQRWKDGWGDDRC